MEWTEAREFVCDASGFDPPSLFAKAACDAIASQDDFGRLLDIGCGIGPIGIFALREKKTKFVTFADIAPEAVEATKKSVFAQIQKKAISAEQAQFILGGFEDLDPAMVGEHDWMSFNPPQLPVAFVDPTYIAEVDASPTMRAFRIGGPDGLAVVREFIHWYGSLATPRPKALLVLSSFLGRRQITAAIGDRVTAEILMETEVPLRKCLEQSASKFSSDTEEMRNRSLSIKDDVWMKQLLAINLR